MGGFRVMGGSRKKRPGLLLMERDQLYEQIRGSGLSPFKGKGVEGWKNGG
jgi:hypothetical protein